MVSSKEFFATWQHSLSADFQQDGVPAKSDSWVTETAKIAMNGEASVVALSGDNSVFAVGVGHEIHVYGVATSQLLQTLREHAGNKIKRLQFQPGGRKIAAGSTRLMPDKYEDMVRVWNLDTPANPSGHLDGAIEAAVAAASSNLSQHWSPEDLEAVDLRTELAKIIGSGQITLDVKHGRVFRGNLPSYSQNPFTHDGRSLLYLPGNNDVVVLDVDTFSERFRLTGHTDNIIWAEPSPNDKVVATSCWDKTVRIWSMDSGEPIHVLQGSTNQNWAGAFSPDGELVAAGSGDQMVRIWRVGTGELLHTLGGYDRWIRSLSFSPDSLHLAAAAGGGTLRVFDVASGGCQQHWQVNIDVRLAVVFIEIGGVRYTGRGDLFFSSTEGRVFGPRIFCGTAIEYKASAILAHTQDPALVSSPNSPYLLAMVNAVSSTEFFATWQHSLSADFQQDGVPAKSDSWVTETAKIAMNGEALVVALSGDNSVFAVGVGHEIHVYDVATSQLLQTLREHAGNKIEKLKFQPGGRKIAAGSMRLLPGKYETMMRVWDLDVPANPSKHLDDAIEAAVAAASSNL
ncbi:WD40-repeat-containing domain protein [Mycena galopus ATCC 62051]|nr:WD40-repeat-containing domain protein [Mycena galopus ATCC 62051]